MATPRPPREGDRGPVRGGLTRVPGARRLALDFGTRLSWVSSPPEHARLQAAAMRAMVARHFGTLPYDASRLPIHVVLNQETGQIESHFPMAMDELQANPETFLAWADRLEEVARVKPHT